MANLTIKNLPDDISDRLRKRATLHGRTLEAEAYDVLVTAIAEEPRRHATQKITEVQTWIAGMRRPTGDGLGAVDALIRDKRREVILDVVSDGLNPKDYFGAEYARICREADWTRVHIQKLFRSRAK